MFSKIIGYNGWIVALVFVLLAGMVAADDKHCLFLDNYGAFQVGDRVFVRGLIDLHCTSACDSADGCLHDNAIDSALDVSNVQMFVGILVQGSECLLMQEEGSALKYELDEYGGFLAGDSVMVVGSLAMSCESACPDAAACIDDNLIVDKGEASNYFASLGTLVERDGCVLFSAGLGGYPRTGEAILVVESGVNPGVVLSGTGAQTTDSIPGKEIYLISYSEMIPFDVIFNLIMPRLGVVSIQPNYWHEVPELQQMSQSFPDQYAPEFQDGQEPQSYYEQPGVEIVRSDSCQSLSTGAGVVVAIIDNGIDFEHSLFEDYLFSTGHDFVDNDTLAAEEPGDVYGHGTFVAGLIRLTSPDALLLPIRSYNGDGAGSSFGLVAAINYAITAGADIINISSGLYSPDSLVQKALADAITAGIVCVAAAGNDGTSANFYPAASETVICVNSIDSMEVLADFSNYGESIDVCAPGLWVYSSLAGDSPWGWWSGTSFSAPVVTGVCALVLASDSTVSPAEMEQSVRASARTEFLWGNITPPDSKYGYGCIDAAAIMDTHSTGTSCCGMYTGGTTGNTNCSSDGVLSLSDITRLIDYVFISRTPLCCPTSGNINASEDCMVTLSDITRLIDAVFISKNHTALCMPSCQQ